MARYKASQPGLHLSMTVNDRTREVEIHETKFLAVNELMDWPKGATILLLVGRKEDRDK